MTAALLDFGFFCFKHFLFKHANYKNKNKKKIVEFLGIMESSRLAKSAFVVANHPLFDALCEAARIGEMKRIKVGIQN